MTSNSSKSEKALYMLMDQVEKLIDRKLEQRKKKSVTVRPVIAYKHVGDNKYLISLDGHEYKVWNGTGVELKECQNVWLMIPHGRMNDMFIFALREKTGRKQSIL